MTKKLSCLRGMVRVRDRVRVRIWVRVKWEPGCLMRVHSQVGHFTPGPTLVC